MLQSKFDDKIFDEIFRSYYSELCLFSNKIIENLQASEDIVQDVFINFWKKKNSIVIESSLKAYLYQSTRNACLNHIRKNKLVIKHKEHILNTDLNYSDNDTMIELELGEKINLEINRLPQKTKEIFKLSRVDKLKYKEIATDLNISIKTVESHISKALKTLTIQLADYLTVFHLMIFFYL